MVLQALLGDSLVLAREGEGRLHILNASAAELWNLCREAGDISEEAMVLHLTQGYSLPESVARSQIGALLAVWRQAGVVVPCTASNDTTFAQNWIIPSPPPRRFNPPQRALELAGCSMALTIDDARLDRKLAPVLAPMMNRGTNLYTYALHLTGGPNAWALILDGRISNAGKTADEAIVTVLHALIDLASRAEDRLLLVHGAGLALPSGAGLLLVAPGGSGKTTLAAALNAEGYGLLSDDVVPVDVDGGLLGLGTPICLKAGSWPVLASRRPEIDRLAIVQRFSEPVRFLPPIGPRPKEPVPLGLMLFPRYQVASAASRRPLTPEAALQGLVEAEAVIRNLTQTKLEALANWVSLVPAYALTYPDIDSGLALVRELVDALPEQRERPR